MQDLKKSGMDMNKARKLLATWAKVGVNDPEQLRKLLIKRSLQPLSSTLFQTVIDAAASFGGVEQAGDAAATRTPRPRCRWRGGSISMHGMHLASVKPPIAPAPVPCMQVSTWHIWPVKAVTCHSES